MIALRSIQESRGGLAFHPGSSPDLGDMVATIVPDFLDTDPRRWRILLLLATAELLGMSVWFAASASRAATGAPWALSRSEIGWLTTIVQLGFVLGTATISAQSRGHRAVTAALFDGGAGWGGREHGADLRLTTVGLSCAGCSPALRWPASIRRR